jgi:hypothetical protein
MSKAEEFRERAKEADEIAKKVRDPEVRRTLEEVARRWREMAKIAERHGW